MCRVEAHSDSRPGAPWETVVNTKLNKHHRAMIKGYIQMWPRAVFDLRDGKKLMPELRESLSSPGVYVLYRDDHPYYIGKAGRKVFHRLWAHANATRDKHYHFWNYFSAYLVPKKQSRDAIEAILIAAMPTTSNSSSPRFTRIHLPKNLARMLGQQRRISVGVD
jgi:hypothetical protein